MFSKGDFVAVGNVEGEVCDVLETIKGTKYRVRYYDVSLRGPDDLWCTGEEMTSCERVNWLTGK